MIRIQTREEIESELEASDRHSEALRKLREKGGLDAELFFERFGYSHEELCAAGLFMCDEDLLEHTITYDLTEKGRYFFESLPHELHAVRSEKLDELVVLLGEDPTVQSVRESRLAEERQMEEMLRRIEDEVERERLSRLSERLSLPTKPYSKQEEFQSALAPSSLEVRGDESSSENTKANSGPGFWPAAIGIGAIFGFAVLIATLNKKSPELGGNLFIFSALLAVIYFVLRYLFSDGMANLPKKAFTLVKGVIITAIVVAIMDLVLNKFGGLSQDSDYGYGQQIDSYRK